MKLPEVKQILTNCKSELLKESIIRLLWYGDKLYTALSINKLKLSNKTGEILSPEDYVAIEYTSVLSSKTAYISFRNGSPKFTGYYKVLSQTEYDTLEANGQVIDTVMYVIVGD